MATSPYTWGIDIGKCALKAVRCRPSPTEPHKLVAEAFDYVEYPMLLSQPEADATALIAAALEEFTGRNTLRGDRVALSVPGQLGLAKFIKLPPIEAKKIPDIVRYEARQQIPFPIEQVVWDWQRLPGGIEEGGFVLDAEVAIFAIKRDQVYKVLAPLDRAGVEVDILQLAPVALANVAMFDMLPPGAADPEKPPPAVVVVSMGVDTTDVVMTNGLRIQQRSMPIGGSSFTKALVKDMQLTFAKAEHLKRHAVRAEDPKAVFKAMRPVFSEFTSELQRSLNYFTTADRSATIGRVVLLGNAAKLRGLSDYVAKQLQLDVQRLETFTALEGPAVTAPAFRENRLGFGTAYGLALQGAGRAALNTNVMPQEIVRDRLIAAKRPWAVAALVGLVAAALLNFAGVYLAWQAYDPKRYEGVFAASDAVKQTATRAESDVETAKQARDEAATLARTFVATHDRRFQALDMLRAVEACLPRNKLDAENIADREELHIDSIDCQFVPDLAVWFAGWKPRWEATHPDKKSDAPPPGDTPAGADAPAAAPGPTGPGWVIQLVGHHYHNEEGHGDLQNERFLQQTLIRDLDGKGVRVTVSAGPGIGSTVPIERLGIGFPIILDPPKVIEVSLADAVAGLAVPSSPSVPMGSGGMPVLPPGVRLPGLMPPSAFAPMDPRRSGGPKPPPNPAMPAAGAENAAPPPDPAEPATIVLKRYDFTVQFCWQPGVDLRPAAAAAAPVVATE